MDIKLIKVEDEWYNLLKSDGELIASDDEDFQHNYKVSKLSTKNCQAIERGYDLDELFDKVDNRIDYHEFDFTSFRLGAEAILELMGDKRFSEEDMRKAYQKGEEDSYTQGGLTKQKEDSYIQSLQQTEWDVEIEMEFNPINHASGLQLTGNELMDISISQNYKPKLDADGCLILKRK